MFRRSTLAPVLAAAALTTMLVACGGDDDDAGSASSTSPAGSTATTAPTDGSVTDLTLVPASPPASTPSIDVPTAAPTELKVTKVQEGSGTPAVDGDVLVVDYVGVRQADGQQFDASYGKTPLVLTLGMGGVIPGWDQGLKGVTAGERVQLDIPASLAYADSPPEGSPIQKGDALTFVVDVRAVIPAPDATKQPVATDLPATGATDGKIASADLVVGTGAELPAGGTGVFLMVYFDSASKSVVQTTWPDGAELVPSEDGDPTTSPASALAGMKVGGRRALTIPAVMAGTESDLVIVLDLLAAV
jgi:FKBP-type peptidyl-prolyl cis-trans isomerase